MAVVNIGIIYGALTGGYEDRADLQLPRRSLRWHTPRIDSKRPLAQRFYDWGAYLDTRLTLSTEAFSMRKNKAGKLSIQVRDLWDTRYVNPGFGGIDIPTLGRQ